MTRRIWCRLALGIVAAMVLAACGSGSGTDATGQTVDRDATLRVALYYAPASLDPHRTTAAVASFVFVAPFYDRLTQLGPDLSLRPMLATSWMPSADGNAMTFSLRDDARFWDGTPVDAQAVKGSLERALHLPGSTVASTLNMIKAVEVVDPRTVRIVTNRPAADLPYALAGIEGAIINPRSLDKPTLDREPDGSGPYRLAALHSNDSVTLERSPGYWDPNAQQAKTIEIRGVPNDSTRLSAFRSGEVDLVMTTMGQYAQAAKLGSGAVTHVYPAATPYSVWLNTGLPNVDNKLVRQALNWAIDREGISKALYNDKCAPNGQPLAQAYRQGRLDAPPIRYGHDPAKAKQLLTEAGLPNGLDLKLLVPSGITAFEQMATAVQSQLQQVGVRVELAPQGSGQIFDSWMKAGQYQGYVNSKSGRPTAAITLLATFLNERYSPGPVPPEFQQSVMSAFDPHLDPAGATAHIERASSIAVEEALDIFVCAAPAIWTSSAKVVGADKMAQSYFTPFGDLRYVGVAR